MCFTVVYIISYLYEYYLFSPANVVSDLAPLQSAKSFGCISTSIE